MEPVKTVSGHQSRLTRTCLVTGNADFPRKGIGPAQTNLLTVEIITSFIEMAEIRVDERWTRSPRAGRTVFRGPYMRRVATLSAVAATKSLSGTQTRTSSSAGHRKNGAPAVGITGPEPRVITALRR